MRRDICIALLAALIGAVSGGSIVARANKPDGYVTEYGDFVPHACERTALDGNGFPDGTERYLISTGPTHEAVCRHEGYVSTGECRANAEWDKEMVHIDYHKQHQVCVTGMPGTYSPPLKPEDFNKPKDTLDGRVYSGDITRCFDLYDIGER